MATVLTSKNFGADGGSRLFSIVVTSTGVSGDESVALASVNATFMGVYHDLSAVGGSSDLTIMHNAVDLLGGIGSALSTTEGYLPAMVTASLTDFAHGAPVVGAVIPTWSGTLATTTGVLVLFFLARGR